MPATVVKHGRLQIGKETTDDGIRYGVASEHIRAGDYCRRDHRGLIYRLTDGDGLLRPFLIAIDDMLPGSAGKFVLVPR